MGGDCLSRKCVSERKRKLVIGKTSCERNNAEQSSLAHEDKSISKMFSHVCLKAFNGER